MGYHDMTKVAGTNSGGLFSLPSCVSNYTNTQMVGENKIGLLETALFDEVLLTVLVDQC